MKVQRKKEEVVEISPLPVGGKRYRPKLIGAQRSFHEGFQSVNETNIVNTSIRQNVV
jgi:hypothetical protein